MNKQLRKLNTFVKLSKIKDSKEVLLSIPIHSNTMKHNDIEPLFELLEVILENNDFIHSFRDRIVLECEGFDTNEFFKIDYARRFLQIVQERFPYWFWFGAKRPPGGKDVLFLKGFLYSQCRFEMETDLGEYVLRQLNESDVMNFLVSSEIAVRGLQEKAKISEDEVVDCLNDVANYFKKNVFRNFQPFDKWIQNLN